MIMYVCISGTYVAKINHTVASSTGLYALLYTVKVRPEDTHGDYIMIKLI